jgi:hypothetical protein
MYFRIMVQLEGHCHHTRKHHISTEELEAKLGIHDIRHYVHSTVLRYLGHVFRMDAAGLHLSCSAVGWWISVVDGSFFWKACLLVPIENTLHGRRPSDPEPAWWMASSLQVKPR